MLGLEELIQQREAQIRDAINRSAKAASDIEKVTILEEAIREVRDALTRVTVSNIPEDFKISNLDEVKLHLRTELSKAVKPLLQALEKLNLTQDQLNQIRKETDVRLANAFEDNFDTVIIRKHKEYLKITNFSDIAFPKDIKVNNLRELQEYFDSLAQVIRETFNVEIPSPQVTVNPPQVNVPEIVMPQPNVDLSGLLKALDPLKFISDRPNKPLSVRLSDGSEFLKAVKAVADGQEKQALAFSQGLTEAGARKAFLHANQPVLGGVGSSELTNAATAAQITAASLPCRYVEISTNAGLANIGTSGAVQTTDGEIGVTIYPGNLPYRVYTDNVNKVYAAGATGTRLSWTYYV